MQYCVASMSKSNASGLVKVTVAHSVSPEDNCQQYIELENIKHNKKLVMDSLKNLSCGGFSDVSTSRYVAKMSGNPFPPPHLRTSRHDVHGHETANGYEIFPRITAYVRHTIPLEHLQNRNCALSQF